ncbi:MAG: hypothetical protein FWC60_09030 [Firmicutes bacterium]|nr:hypothetical protein [Bacillota bacterium]
MKLFSSPLIILFCLVINYQAAVTFNRGHETDDPTAIKQLVSDALEYNGWVNEPDYQERLGSMYSGALLTKILTSVKQFRSVCTDWSTLTFVSNCHIVYQDGSSALVLALFYDQNPDGTTEDRSAALLKLSNTSAGWRITAMNMFLVPGKE